MSDRLGKVTIRNITKDDMTNKSLKSKGLEAVKSQRGGWTDEGLAKFRSILEASMRYHAKALGYRKFGLDRLASLINNNNPSKPWSRDTLHRVQKIGLPGHSKYLPLNLLYEMVRVEFLWNEAANRPYEYNELIVEIGGAVGQCDQYPQIAFEEDSFLPPAARLAIEMGVVDRELLEPLPQSVLKRLSELFRKSLKARNLDSLEVAKDYSIPHALMFRLYFGEWGEPGSSTAIPKKYLEIVAKFCYRAEWVGDKLFIDTDRQTYEGDLRALLHDIAPSNLPARI